MFQEVVTTPYLDQKPGTSGLRKKVTTFKQQNYLQNYIQSIFNSINAEGKSLLVGGDGRYYNYDAIQIIIKMAAANKVKKLYIGQNGIMSTPAASNIIRKYKLDGAIILSASHNEGGINGDFGCKYNIDNGGPAPENITNDIFEHSKVINKYYIYDVSDIEINEISDCKLENMEIEIIDSVEDYAQLMQDIFDFEAIAKLFRSGFTMKFDAMHAVSGPYAKKIFEDMLGAEEGSVINGIPKEDFNGGHPDPNLVWAKELTSIMYGDNAPDIGAASDGDADRNLIMGKAIAISPADSLAFITDNAQYIPYYKDKVYGVARSLPTCQIVDKVATAKQIPCYEVPTGWKFFGNLLDAKKITFCGEESYGTGSNHIREKDGVWAVLCWLNIIAFRNASVTELMNDFWQTHGRYYVRRHDFENISTDDATKVMEHIESTLANAKGQEFANMVVSDAYSFDYEDTIDGSITKNQGLVFLFGDNGRVVFRLSGTGTSGATIRVYLDAYDADNLHLDIDNAVSKLQKAAMVISNMGEYTGKISADVVT